MPLWIIWLHPYTWIDDRKVCLVTDSGVTRHLPEGPNLESLASSLRGHQHGRLVFQGEFNLDLGILLTHDKRRPAHGVFAAGGSLFVFVVETGEGLATLGTRASTCWLRD